MMTQYRVFESEIMLLREQNCQSDREVVCRYSSRGLGILHGWLSGCREMA